MGEKRVWRMKSKLTPVCIDLMDVNDDGALEVRALAPLQFHTLFAPSLSSFL